MRRPFIALVLVLGVVAAPAAAADEQRQVVDNCAATVPSGRGIALNPVAVLEPIAGLLAPLDPLGVVVPAFRSLWVEQPPIPLPAAPSGIPGTVIADAVLARLAEIPLLSPVLDALTAPLRGRLGMTCGIAITPRVAPVPEVTGTAAAPPATAPEAALLPPPPPVEAVTVLPGATPADPGPPAGEPPPPPRSEPSAEGQQLRPLAAATISATAEAPPPEPADPHGVLLLAGLLNLLVATQLGRVWILRGAGSSGRSARPLDPGVVP